MQKQNLEPEIDLKDDDEEASLPELPPDLPELPQSPEDSADAAASGSTGAAGRGVIVAFARHAPQAPGVYRMIGAGGEVLYVGKAKNIRKRILSYARPAGHVSRIARMVAAT